MLGNICFSEQIFYGKQSLGAPDVWSNCALKHLPGYKARKNATRELMWFWLKDDLCDHFIHNGMKAWGKIGSSEKLGQQLYVCLEKVTFFSKLLSFTVITSLVTNGFRLITGCFVLGYANSTSLKFRVSAYCRMSKVKVQLKTLKHAKRLIGN